MAKYLYIPFNFDNEDPGFAWYSPQEANDPADPFMFNEIMHMLHTDNDSLYGQVDQTGFEPRHFRGSLVGPRGRKVIWSSLPMIWDLQVQGAPAYKIGRLSPGATNSELGFLRPEDKLVVVGHCAFESRAMGFKCHGRREGPDYVEAWDAFILSAQGIADVLAASGLRQDIRLIELRGCFTGLASGTSSTNFEPRTCSPFAREVAKELGQRGYNDVLVGGYMHETERANPTSKFIAGPGDTASWRINPMAARRMKNIGAGQRRVWFRTDGSVVTSTIKPIFFKGAWALRNLEDAPHPFYVTEPVAPAGPAITPAPMSAFAMSMASRTPAATRGASVSISASDIATLAPLDDGL